MRQPCGPQPQPTTTCRHHPDPMRPRPLAQNRDPAPRHQETLPRADCQEERLPLEQRQTAARAHHAAPRGPPEAQDRRERHRPTQGQRHRATRTPQRELRHRWGQTKALPLPPPARVPTPTTTPSHHRHRAPRGRHRKDPHSSKRDPSPPGAARDLRDPEGASSTNTTSSACPSRTIVAARLTAVIPPGHVPTRADACLGTCASIRARSCEASDSLTTSAPGCNARMAPSPISSRSSGRQTNQRSAIT